MFGKILISICTFMHLYVFWRAASVPLVYRHIPRAVLIGLGVILWAVFLAGRIIGHGGNGLLAGLLEFFGMNWLGALFLIFISLLAVDLFTRFGLFFPSLSALLRGWALLAGIVMSGIALFQGLRAPVINDYAVNLKGLPPEMDGTVLVALSDMHLGSLIGEHWLAARVAQVNAQKPDLVVLLGDIFEGHGPSENRLITLLQQVNAPLGVWAVAGNHEFHGGSGIHLFEQAGIKLLRNRWVEIRTGFVLAGIDDLTFNRRGSQGRDYISQALKDHAQGAVILMSHTPWQADKAAKAGAGLMLSGHTHAGQIWPFSYLVRLRYPLLAGRYTVNGMPVIVCRGTGTWGPRLRLWYPGEILRVTLRQKH